MSQQQTATIGQRVAGTELELSQLYETPNPQGDNAKIMGFYIKVIISQNRLYSYNRHLVMSSTWRGVRFVDCVLSLFGKETALVNDVFPSR